MKDILELVHELTNTCMRRVEHLTFDCGKDDALRGKLHDLKELLFDGMAMLEDIQRHLRNRQKEAK